VPGSKKRIFDGLTKDQRHRLKDLDAYRAKRREQQKRWREANPEKHREISRESYRRHGNSDKWRATRRERHLIKNYGITSEQLQAMIASQAGRCAICSVEFRSLEKRAVHVDHCHQTGAVRGVLCHSCNTKLGWYERMFDRIAAYLADTSEKESSG